MNALGAVSGGLAPPRLSRSQLTQKVGARGRYPRRSGIIVPERLSDMVRDAHLPGDGLAAPASDDGREQLGREVVQIVARAQRRFSEAFLELPMPHPTSALALPIEDRTRNVIERLLPIIRKEPVWTIARYLGIPQFGARCLVDLLSATEEDDRAGRS